MLGMDGMRHIVPELPDLVNRLMKTFPLLKAEIFFTVLIRGKKIYGIVHA
jgi:hypothetical protein